MEDYDYDFLDEFDPEGEMMGKNSPDYSADPRSKKIDYQLQQAGRGRDQVDDLMSDADAEEDLKEKES